MRAEDGFRGVQPSGGLPLGCDRSACYSGRVLWYGMRTRRGLRREAQAKRSGNTGMLVFLYREDEFFCALIRV